jgi:hypothetical protein
VLCWPPFFSPRGGPRTGHGRSHQEDQVRSSQTSLFFICENIDLFERGNRLSIFVLRLIQIPMIAVAWSPAIKRNKSNS